MIASVGQGLAPADAGVILSQYGRIAEQQLFALENRYPYVKIDKYIIMPTHIRAIIQFLDESAESMPRPTLIDVVCAYKSLTTRAVNTLSNTPGRKYFQTSFFETVLRNEQAYRECWRYIDENPAKWLLDPEDL